ncbi:MAG: transglutaminase family protein [Bacteroidota bacterium]
MPNPDDLPHLLALLDDEEDLVRENVYNALAAFGPELPTIVQPWLVGLSDDIRSRLNFLWEKMREQIFQENWLSWLEIEDESEALETALSWLGFTDGGLEDQPLSQTLDNLFHQFLATDYQRDLSGLMRFLFRDFGLRQPEKEYYHPRNSNLVYVIEQGFGLQISLSCVVIFMAARLNIQLYGFNMPGHFMVMSIEEEQFVVYDVFRQGKPLPKETLRSLVTSSQLNPALSRKWQATNEDIVARVLRNICLAYDRKGQGRHAKRFLGYLSQLQQELKLRKDAS